MFDKINSKRYQNPQLREKLAGEYVLGTQTSRVRRRMEALIKADQTWWTHIEQWQHHLSGLNPSSDLNASTKTFKTFKKPSKRVWTNIANSTFGLSKREKSIRWWWLPTGMAFSLFVGIFLQPTLMQPSSDINIAEVRPASYLAMMSSDTQTNHFALVAYQGDALGQSSLRMQRNLSMDKISQSTAMVWMRDNSTGKLKLIDSLQNINDIRYMSPNEWKMLKSSSELLVTANKDPNSEVLYRGRCVELSDWRAI